MTVDTSRSCLGLATSVGSAIRQIVDARVLLTATAPPALPGSPKLSGSLAPPLAAIIGCDDWLRSLAAIIGCDHWSLCNQSVVTVTCRAMAQTKPDSSRAIAVVTMLAGLPVRASLR